MTNAIKRALGMVVVTGGLALSALTAQAEGLNDVAAACRAIRPSWPPAPVSAPPMSWCRRRYRAGGRPFR
ncbi:MAG: hypothetical protein U1F47_02230 [Hyphomicrobiales bacterium]